MWTMKPLVYKDIFNQHDKKLCPLLDMLFIYTDTVSRLFLLVIYHPL